MKKLILTILFLLMANLYATDTKVLILLGPPGAGKGSQAVLIKEKMHLPHISTGDLLRENIKEKTPLGEKAKTFMDAGQLVPDDLIFDMLFTRTQKEDCQKGYILDGFPRNLSQAEVLSKKLSDANVVAINLSVPDATIVDRLSNRLICKKCQAPYHLIYSAPKVAGKCDKCDGELYQRSDDTKEVVEKRLKVYHEQTSPLIDYYSKKKALHTIDSTSSKDAILLEILKIVSKP